MNKVCKGCIEKHLDPHLANLESSALLPLGTDWDDWTGSAWLWVHPERNARVRGRASAAFVFLLRRIA